MSVAKPEVLLLAIKHSSGGKNLQSIMNKIVKDLRGSHGDRANFEGQLLDNDQEHDVMLQRTLAETKFDIISFGGGIPITSESWAKRVRGIIEGSQCKGAKILEPTSPQNAVELAKEAVERMVEKSS